MNKLLMLGVAASALAVAEPANATLQLAFASGASTLFCADGMPCDLAGPTKNLLVLDQQVGAFHIEGTFSASTPNELSESNLTITNTSGAKATLDFSSGDTGFTAPVSAISMSGAATFEDALTGFASLSFHADPTNTQGAAFAGDNPGVGLFTPTLFITKNPQSFSGDDIRAAFTANAPFSMTEDFSVTLPAGGSVVGLESAMTAGAIPEVRTWVMMFLGFGAMAFFGMRQRKSERLTA